MAYIVTTIARIFIFLIVVMAAVGVIAAHIIKDMCATQSPKKVMRLDHVSNA